jgi:hypothetical protein
MKYLVTFPLMALMLAGCIGQSKNETSEKIQYIPIESPIPDNEYKQNPGDDLVMGDTKGNGGGGWLCTTDGVEKMYQLDLYEAKNLYKIELADYDEKTNDILADITQKIADLDPKLGALFRSHLEYFQLNAERIEGQLDPVKDYGALVTPTGCDQLDYISIVNYTHHEVPYIDQNSYTKLDRRGRAALITHEVIYVIRRKLFSENHSIPSRLSTGYLFAKDWTKYRDAFAKQFNLSDKKDIKLCDTSEVQHIQNFDCHRSAFSKLKGFVPIPNLYKCFGVHISINKTNKRSMVELEYYPQEITSIKNVEYAGEIFTTTNTDFYTTAVEVDKSAYGYNTYEKILDYQGKMKMVLRSADDNNLLIEIITPKNKNNISLPDSKAFGDNYKVNGYARCIAE